MGITNGSTNRAYEPASEGSTAGAGSRGRRGNGLASDGERHQGRAQGEGLATALGWFSIGLGLAQLTAPGGMASLVGAGDGGDNRRLMRGLGMREIASGIGLLTRPQPAEWMWSRVAGDVMDLALLGATLRSGDARRGRTVAATAAVLGVAALDYYAAQRLSRGGSAERGIRVRKSITVNRPAEEVYGFWRDFENLPRFMRHLESVETTGEGRSHWKAKGPAGTAIEWDAETTEDRPNELIAWRSVEGADVDNDGVVRFTPAAGGRGTEVHVELNYEPPAGKLGAMVAKLFGEEPHGQVADDLRRFKQVLETGEVVYSDASLHRGMHAAQPPKERQFPRDDSEARLVADRSAAAAATTTSNLDRSSTTARSGHGEARA